MKDAALIAHLHKLAACGPQEGGNVYERCREAAVALERAAVERAADRKHDTRFGILCGITLGISIALGVQTCTEQTKPPYVPHLFPSLAPPVQRIMFRVSTVKWRSDIHEIAEKIRALTAGRR